MQHATLGTSTLIQPSLPRANRPRSRILSATPHWFHWEPLRDVVSNGSLFLGAVRWRAAVATLSPPPWALIRCVLTPLTLPKGQFSCDMEESWVALGRTQLCMDQLSLGLDTKRAMEEDGVLGHWT